MSEREGGGGGESYVLPWYYCVVAVSSVSVCVCLVSLGDVACISSVLPSTGPSEGRRRAPIGRVLARGLNIRNMTETSGVL